MRASKVYLNNTIYKFILSENNMAPKISQHAWRNLLFLLWSSQILQTSVPDLTESFNLRDLLHTFVVLLNDRFKWYFIKYIENAIRRKRQVKDR
jgi:hypothetical protein